MGVLARFEGVSIGYPGKVLASGIDWRIEDRSFWAIVGPNGAGKSTLVRTLLGMQKAIAGEVHHEAARVGYVPQRNKHNPLMPLSVLDVVLMGLYGELPVAVRPGRKGRLTAMTALEQLKMADKARESFSELSGGQQQRVLIARALAARPNLLVLDEPTAGLDLVSEVALHQLLEEFCREQGIAIIMVSHSLEAVANYAESLVMLAAGRAEVGPVAELLTDATLSRLYGQPIQAPRMPLRHD